MDLRISVIIPAHNASAHLSRCLTALRDGDCLPFEVIVVDDNSSDDTGEMAERFPVKLLRSECRMGPSFCRNVAAKLAKGDVLFFLDSDVCVHATTLRQIHRSFQDDAELVGLMGSYDNSPVSQDFLSQYRNLMHAYVHQAGAERASTFWSGCGAIRREIFAQHNGFDEEYRRPAIEDIELGYRLLRAGNKVVLDRSILVTHLKRWTFWGLVKTDIFDRGIPWTELILRDRCMPNDLNLQLSQRVSVALVFVLVGSLGTMALLSGVYVLVPMIAIVFLMLARWWGEFGSYQRPRIAFTILLLVVCVTALTAYLHGMYGMVLPLLVSPPLLVLRHRYNNCGKLVNWHRNLGTGFLCASVCLTAVYLPAGHLTAFACFTSLVLLALLNSHFYIFLAENRGMGFMLAAIPFHLLYHFYNGLSFAAGAGRHYWATVFTSNARQAFESTEPSGQRAKSV